MVLCTNLFPLKFYNNFDSLKTSANNAKMGDFPTEDEEFELMYGDDLDALNDLEEATSKKISSDNNKENIQTPSTQAPTLPPDEPKSPLTPQNSNDTSRKRTIQELFHEFDEILEQSTTKKQKFDDLALIEHIVELRKLNQDKLGVQSTRISNFACESSSNRDKDNYSLRVPTYPFARLKRSDGEEVYVRMHSDAFEKDETTRLITEIMNKTALNDSSELNRQIEELSQQQTTEKAEEPPEISDREPQTLLWVEKYKPRKYFELLSDESTNRVLLKWLKLWDKCVFHRNPKVRSSTNKFEREFALKTELDDLGRPFYKVALLAGPPGIGKTTLAHMVAQHLGYNVVEINASDDRSVEAFKSRLENATQMQSVLDKDKRPNCMVFDEIDGAPAASINYLVKFIAGAAKLRKKAEQRHAAHLRRPIICICNDLYVPALRPLRQIAFVVNFPAISAQRLGERLMEIARRQRINTDLGVMIELAKKSGSDIRSCLGVLQFFRSRKKLLLSHVQETTVGRKDARNSLFTTLDRLFFVKNAAKSASLKQRMAISLEAVNSFGDFDKLAAAVFENYPNLMVKSSNLGSTCEAMEWFCFNDLISNRIYTVQDYQLFPYLQYSFVGWHLAFATKQWEKLKLAEDDSAARKNRIRHKAILAEVVAGLKPAIRMHINANSFHLDVLPFLKTIIIPKFRAINLHLHTQEEKDSLDLVVDVMIDYNLNYVQERMPDGTYSYKLDPNVVEVVDFGSVPALSYSNKQIIAQQLQTKRIQKDNEIVYKERTMKTSHQSCKAVINKDFFGRPIQSSSSSAAQLSSLESDATSKFRNDIWFKYKEGYSNAVKKVIKISCLK